MQIQTLQFGTLTVPDHQLITMRKPVLGFERLRTFCLVDPEEYRPFKWLQSAEDATVAFMVVNPLLFFPDYRIRVHSNELADLLIDRLDRVETYVIVTVPESIEDISVNLQGPVLLNTENNRAKQLVLVNSEYQVCHRLLDTGDTITPPLKGRTEEPVAV